MKSLIFVLSLFFVTSTFLSCTKEERVPSSVISEEKMVDILVDVHMVEAMARHNQLKDNNQRANMYYNYILEKHNITLNQLDSSISWYAKHPTTYIRVYDQIIPRLEHSLEMVRTNANTGGQALRTLDIWEKKNEYQLTSLQNSNVPFRIEENATIRFSLGDEFVLKTKFSCKNVPSSLQLVMQVKIHFTDSTESIFEKKIVTTNPDFEQILRIQPDSKKQIAMISGDLCYLIDKIDNPIPIEIRIFNVEMEQITK